MIPLHYMRSATEHLDISQSSIPTLRYDSVTFLNDRRNSGNCCTLFARLGSLLKKYGKYCASANMKTPRPGIEPGSSA